MTSIPSLRGVIVILLYGLITCTHGEKDDGMSFTRHPQPLAAPLHDDVNFECSLNLPAESFAWHHRPLGARKWVPLSHPSGGGKTSRHVVNFNNVSKAGDYRCIAFFGTSGFASDPARLTLATIQKFSDKSDVFIQVAEGNTVPITCPMPYSEPEAIVMFFKNNALIKDASLVNSRTMVIKNVRVTDSGSYHCSAENYITQQTFTSMHKIILTVHTNVSHQEPYLIKQSQTEYTVVRDKNVTLECFGAGYPVPRVSWSRLGSSLPLKSERSSTGLTIVHVQPSDRGEYDCVWSNSVGQIKSVIILRVMEPPKVTKQPKASTFSEGGELELSCAVTGEPEPTVEWLINGETLTPSKNQEIRSTTLFIAEVEKKHAGIVQCVASNDYGSHSSGYNLLRVSPKQHVLGGTTESKPDYGISVSRHKHTRGGGRRRNKEGKRKGTGAVLVPPDQPNVTRLSDTSVMVRWSVPDNKGLPIQFFKVQYRELAQKANGKQAKWMTANTEIPNHVRSFEVPDLQPGYTYRFRIAAVYSNNDNKLSPNSGRFRLNRVSENSKMPVPLLNNTKALGPHQVLLIWENPDKSASIDGFYIYHRASTSAGDYLKTTVEGKDAYNMTISHLQPDTTYEFKVQSFSVDAASEFSKILRQKTKKIIVEHPVQQVLAENKVKPSETNISVSVYVIIAIVFVASVFIGIVVTIIYKKVKYKQSRGSSQNEGKPIANGRVINGGVTDSKINITSNPLAGLDASEDIIQPKSGQQSSMEMTSFLNGQNNNSNSHNNGDTAGSDVVNATSRSEPSSLLQGPLPIEQRL
ncbi:interference hedgehog isoform X1 [Harpegnathos saltator]|uniref:Interference hedgehog n=1 Tax=Harpegnathos saltator TaxID=610380 RepID=E2BPT6_HARSA|nr:interference hedgehog isoform X1 [Harpegnathos saltator]XP_025163914.1 interference hedgehog isoform X1 [Harpegnathos saltator]XP_025163915.1 interference hedgehog isoform X1 [Harpegnathos saltator]XP_025163916.1 interference hedgehog isoform X1 [Harpegnathos saltator]EFN82287.1 Brother of CDO [Harpegnathos saltator]